MSLLKIEKHPEFDKLHYCFRKIEALAERHGLEIDELVEQPYEKDDMPFFAGAQKALAEKRMRVLLKDI